MLYRSSLALLVCAGSLLGGVVPQALAAPQHIVSELILTHKFRKDDPKASDLAALRKALHLKRVDDQSILASNWKMNAPQSNAVVRSEVTDSECRRFMRAAKRQGFAEFLRAAHYLCSNNYMVSICMHLTRGI
jgi:hypothetical protein